MSSIYHTLRKNNSASTRLLVREILRKNNCSISKATRIFSISRQTVRRARDGTLSDLSRKPKHSPNRIKDKRRTGESYTQRGKKNAFWWIGKP